MDNKTRLVVGLSVIPSRLNTINNILNSLNQQSRMPDKIYLYVPEFYKRFNMKSDLNAIKKQISEYSLVEIKTGEDYGPISKLFVLLEYETNNDAIIVTCDDDVIYHESWLAHLEKQSLKFPDSAVGYRGRIFGNDLNYKNAVSVVSTGLKKDSFVDLVTAVRGWAYRRKFFDLNYVKEWKETEKNHPYIFFNDDIWISGTLQKMNIKKIVFVNDSFNSKAKRLPAALTKMKNQMDKTNKHIRLFEKYWDKK